MDKKNIAKNTAKNEIDKNTPTFCQKHSGYIFASGKSGSTPASWVHLNSFPSSTYTYIVLLIQIVM